MLKTFISISTINNLIFYISFEILERFWKLVILNTLGMTGHTLQDWYHQLVNKVCWSLCKKPGHSNLLSWDITKILQTCYFGYLRHTCLPKPRKTKSPCWKLCCLFTYKKLTWFVTSFLRYCTLRNSSIWLANRILSSLSNLRKRLVSGKGFTLKYKWQYDGSL